LAPAFLVAGAAALAGYIIHNKRKKQEKNCQTIFATDDTKQQH
jgi:hypothetical protein